MTKKRVLNKDFRLQVNLQCAEGGEIKAAAHRENETVPAYVRRVLLAELSCNPVSEEKKSQLKKIEFSQENLASRILKMESVLRILVVNTAIIRGHVVGVAELSPQVSREVLEKKMVESRDLQKKMFFDLYPEMREAAK